jgi:hypothetical protein
VIQLGTRWSAGAEPPQRLSEEFVTALREVETTPAGAADGGTWTLTWLEGRPTATLEPGGGSEPVAVHVDATGAVVTARSSDWELDETW